MKGVSITLDKTTATLNPGDTLQLTATVDGTSGAIVWGSTNPSVATVDSQGTVNAIAAGTAKISAAVSGCTVVCEITVENKMTWTVYGTDSCYLKISGTGDMKDYTALSGAPWSKYHSKITSVIIEDGITSIGAYAFYNFFRISAVWIPASVTRIDANAFMPGISQITKVYYGGTEDEWNEIRGVTTFYKCLSSRWGYKIYYSQNIS
ncbi:MAG: Ig-like domain-containing protein [Lachnospiraceae bacterium]|nr:Ig-like domain-containing protein [Lachnospiraceae bacterium]